MLSVATSHAAQVAPPDRGKLRTELMALYNQYISDATNAVMLQTEYEEMIEKAKSEHRSAQKRIEIVRTMLETEFPGWER